MWDWCPALSPSVITGCVSFLGTTLGSLICAAQSTPLHGLSQHKV